MFNVISPLDLMLDVFRTTTDVKFLRIKVYIAIGNIITNEI